MDDNPQLSIRQQLLQRFKDFSIGDRLPSDRALAKEFAVAYLTINRLMSQLNHEGYVERKARSGTFLASRERITAHDHLSGCNAQGSILCAYPNYYSFAIWQRTALIEQGTVHRGQGYIEYKMSQSSSYEHLVAFAESRTDISGIILIPSNYDLNADYIDSLNSLNIPIALLEYGLPISGQHNFHTLCTDWHRMGYVKAETMLQNGHQNLCFIAHDPKGPMLDKIIDGMKQALRDAKVPESHLHIQGNGIKPGKNARDAGYTLTLQALKNRKRHQSTGFIYGSYGGVTAGLRACYEQNISVPHDISIIATGKGNGDEDMERPRISTVTSNIQSEVDTAFAYLENPKAFSESTTLFYPKYIQRESITHPTSD